MAVVAGHVLFNLPMHGASRESAGPVHGKDTYCENITCAEGNVPTCNGKAPSTAKIVQFEAPQPPRKCYTKLFEIRSI